MINHLKISDLLERFFSESIVFQNHSIHTVEWYKRTIGIFLKQYPNIQYIDQFDQDIIERFLYTGRLEKDWKIRTLINYLDSFKGFSSWCLKKGYIKSNPALSILKPKREKVLPKSISKESALKLLEASYHMKYSYRFPRYRNRALMAIMLFAGLRIRECLEIRLNDIDLSNNSIFINQGKGHKDRYIPMSPQLKLYLFEYIKERERLKKSHFYFFSSTNRDKPMTYHGVMKMICLLRKKINVNFTPHMLRHTFATLMIEGGCDIYSLSKMMGHSDIKTTTIYLSASSEHLQKQIYKHPLNNL